MKIDQLTNIDLTQYRLAYYRGDSFGHYTLCQDEVMAMAEGGKSPVDKLLIALIPKAAKLTACGGDDWNDSPAECNASGFYEYPKGTIFLSGELGGELRLHENIEGWRQ